jgi:hypothetical protein
MTTPTALSLGAQAEDEQAERDRLAVAVLVEAAARTHSPSDRLAYSMDQALVTHPEWCSTNADYPDWTPGVTL